MPETSHEKRIKLIDLPGLTHMYKNLKKIFIRIRDIDTSLDTNSSNPIANNVVTQKFNTIQSQFSNAVDQLSDAVIASGGTISKSGEVATPAQIAAGIQTVQENAMGGAMVGDAVAANVLYGKTFTNAETSGLTGAMPDNSSTADRGGNGTAPGISSNHATIPTRQGANLQMTTDTAGTVRINIGVPAGYWPGEGSAYVNRPASEFGNAAQENVLNTVSFTSTAGIKKNGSMPNQGAQTKSLNCGESYTIPTGYHNGSGKVTANSLASQTGVDSGKTAAGDAQILTGYQAWVNGAKRTGSMPNNGTWVSINGSVDSEIAIPKGYHSGSGYVKVGYPVQTETYIATIRGTALDMGASNKNRYVNTSGVPNNNTGTYTLLASETGTKDLGATHSYRYINAANVYNTGYTDGQDNSAPVLVETVTDTSITQDETPLWILNKTKEGYFLGDVIFQVNYATSESAIGYVNAWQYSVASSLYGGTAASIAYYPYSNNLYFYPRKNYYNVSVGDNKVINSIVIKYIWLKDGPFKQQRISVTPSKKGNPYDSFNNYYDWALTIPSGYTYYGFQGIAYKGDLPTSGIVVTPSSYNDGGSFSLNGSELNSTDGVIGHAYVPSTNTIVMGPGGGIQYDKIEARAIYAKATT